MNVSLKKLTDALARLQSQINALGSGTGGGVQSIVAGANITVDDTDPQNPVVSATGSSGTTSFDPASLFGSGDDGVYFDPNDISTLFQDTAGTVPVTAAGQTVKCMLDKSGNGHSATQASAPPTYQVDAHGVGYLALNGSQYLDCGSGMNANTFCGCVAFEASAANQRVLDTRGTGTPGTVVGWCVKASNPGGSDGFVVDDGSTFKASSYVIPTGVSHALYFDHATSNAIDWGLDDSFALSSATGSALGTVQSTKTSRIGAASNDGSQGLVGRFYGAVVVKRALTRTEIQNLRRWCVDKVSYF